MGALRALAAEKTHAHRGRFIGRTLEAITLRTPEALAAQKRTAALTENFLPVEMAGRLEANRLVRVRVSGLTARRWRPRRFARQGLAQHLRSISCTAPS